MENKKQGKQTLYTSYPGQADGYRTSYTLGYGFWTAVILVIFFIYLLCR